MGRQNLRSPSKMQEKIKESFWDSSRNLRDLTSIVAEVERAGIAMVKALKGKKKVIAFGNGGSAADAQHLTAELSGRFEKERRGLPAVALTTNSSSVTAIGNDYAYDQVFSRQLQGLAQAGDIVVAISTSGNSPNVLKGIQEAKKAKSIVIGWTGRSGGKMKAMVDICLQVPSDRTSRIQEGHLAILHALCGMIDDALAPSAPRAPGH